MIASGAPPSYVESLSHQVVAGPGVPHQFSSPYATQASAAAVSAAQLQNYKVGGVLCSDKVAFIWFLVI